MIECPFCVEISGKGEVKVCKDCNERLRRIDRIVKSWNNSVKNKISVEVCINAS